MSDGYLSFWGAIIAALLGALVLIRIARKTAETVQDNYKAEKLIEAKRDIYLDLIDRWMNYLFEINSFRINSIDDYSNKFFQANKELVSSLHKSSFISEPKTKLLVMDLVFDLTLKNNDIYLLVKNWYGIKSNRNDVEKSILKISEELGDKAQKLQIILREELGIKNDEAIDVKINEMKNTFVKSSNSGL